MVVAEVPLWVVHSSAASGASGILSKTTAPAVASSPLTTDDTTLWKERASESLSLLESVGGGKKCAIYSVDVHPKGTKFATGGGDGAVRIWSTSTLFSKHRGKFQDKETYESCSSGESSDSSPGSGGEDHSEEPQDSTLLNQEEVHDLNQLVRRKKDGSVPSKHITSLPTTGVPPVTSNQPPTKESQRLLCTLSAHTGSSVLAVRFSPSGQYLASAGDDAVVCIYTRSSSSYSTAVNNLDHNIEHWLRIKLCRGHTLDVVGLAWAPDDSHLVSCSLDSDAPIIVWKLTDLASDQPRTQSNVLCNPYKILGRNIHTSTVKGVTFDPAGTYLASSGDDPAVCIWRAHDDWGLEKRIDSGIFRKGKENDTKELSGQTLFRRLSWSTDGTYICSTNSTVKNKHVASTIAREGWAVSGSPSAAAGAANLVGHKQPVVVSRHCPQLLDTRVQLDNADDEEPDYATLVALGDKRGFVTVWSTRKPRPIFKLQCSESRCTVTDLAWGRDHDNKNMTLLVSLLDGYIVALRFAIPEELGHVLSDKDQKRVFQLRYGIDLDDGNGLGRRRIFVGDNSGPKLIENPLQFSLEEQVSEDDGDHAPSSDEDKPIRHLALGNAVRTQQSESVVKGKKRIRPVLIGVDIQPKDKKQKNGESKPENGGNGKKEKKNPDRLKDALESAAQAASAAEGGTLFAKRDVQKGRQESVGNTSGDTDRVLGLPQHHRQPSAPSPNKLNVPKIPHSTNRIHSVELPVASDTVLAEDCESIKMVADCTNTVHVPTGSSGHSLPCITVSISRGGKTQWKDEIMGTSCSAVAGSQTMLAVGSSDGCVFLYGSSPTVGWASGRGFRSHPPLVLGQAIVALQLVSNKEGKELEMMVVTGDGVFGVYRIVPDLILCYKGSILPAMTHMMLSSTNSGHTDAILPKLARIHITESDHLFLILSLESDDSSRSENARNRTGVATPAVGVGGALQAFAYNRAMELWMRVSDSRFLLSDFYSILPTTKSSSSKGILSGMDDAVRTGSAMSSLKATRKNGYNVSSGMYEHLDESAGMGNNIITRSHCEDRLACAMSLGSAPEFQSWLVLYVQTLAMGGQVDHLRLLVDLLMGGDNYNKNMQTCWWLSSAPTILGLDRKHLVTTIVIQEMSKNRALQRVTNEIALEVECSMERTQ